ncbi:MAG: low molecular weight protein-tyrosine-phosphatase [Pseudomonadota bacterium]
MSAATPKPTSARRILVVCLGNICRSPMGEGVLRKMAAEAALDLEIDSAGTGAYHLDDPPQEKGLAVAAARGYDNSAQRARQVAPEDFTGFDLILGMDSANLANLRRMAPAGATARIEPFDPAADVPDPWGHPRAVYEATLDQIEAAGRGWIKRLGG